jgi:hypothetical protein
MSDVTQRNGTRNQSTADYQTRKIFIFDNRFIDGKYFNNTAGALDVQTGLLVVRDKVTPANFLPATAANLADVVGIVDSEGVVSLGAGLTLVISVCTKGTIDSNQLVLPAAVTLDTVVGNKTLRDVLEAIGFHIDSSTVENTKFDN